ncbi:hypothetical protein CLV98_110141 [Dyadobacter jejuensis]|uniref:Uncharacterized protein n=1 Tax=Dyadobacter jejuensis TaxID=1082580 RepID=A0A316AIX0_9BACT|nr:hypothetical protein [Dyadobacter jejuensis]PWJ56830.1 hypothetical protein CLV98_110141 [Dyadobacter jejuensis]
MKYINFLFLLVMGGACFAHQPNLSSLMIYEQNGKKLLVIKSSLTGFEGEVNYRYHKDAFKTPEEFRQLVIQQLQEFCEVVVNDQSIAMKNPQVILGHETTVFAELDNFPDSIQSIYVKNELFVNTPNSLSELILSLKELPQKQVVLSEANQYEVKLKLDNSQWIALEPKLATSNHSNMLVLGAVSIVLIVGLVWTARFA